MRARQAVSFRDELQNLPNLPQHLQRLLRQIPLGCVTTHGLLAAALGNRVASRWVGHYILHHDHRLDCVCHRVVRADGTLGGFVTGRPEDKAQALRVDGVACAQGRVNLQAYRFSAFRGPQPLQQLERLQQELGQHLRLSGHTGFKRIAGVDVSYRGRQGYAAYVEVEPTSRAVVWSMTTERPVDFPYISSYLAFRELPILLDLVQQVKAERPLAELLMVDGSGIAHPRRMGLATMLGIATTVPTVGITKRLLSGQVNLTRIQFGEEREIRDSRQQLMGIATLPWPRTGKPIYISPGHLVSVAQAARLVRQYLGERRLPEPIYWADRISRSAAGRQRNRVPRHE